MYTTLLIMDIWCKLNKIMCPPNFVHSPWDVGRGMCVSVSVCVLCLRKDATIYAFKNITCCFYTSKGKPIKYNVNIIQHVHTFHQRSAGQSCPWALLPHLRARAQHRLMILALILALGIVLLGLVVCLKSWCVLLLSKQALCTSLPVDKPYQKLQHWT